jgi:hypothetical protein
MEITCTCDGRRRNMSPAATGRAIIASPSFTLLHTPDEIEFMMAMDNYKRINNRPFPTWHEVLAVLKGLGYMKSEDAWSNRDTAS